MPKPPGRTGKEMSMYIDNDVANELIKRSGEEDRKPGWYVSNGLRSVLGLPPKEIKPK